MSERRINRQNIEWPTVVMLAASYAAWLTVTWFSSALGPWLFVLFAAPVVTLHSSLQHEALHGHPTRSAALNEALVFPPLGLLFPYRRFKSLHLKHHDNSALTDPYDDPESFYYSMADWQKLPAWLQTILDFNNTFLGRFTIGPLVMLIGFVGAEIELIRRGERQVLIGWGRHVVGLTIVFAWTAGVCGIPVWLYVGSAYLGLSIINLRTFAEHQAHETQGGRTAIVEASPLFALLFLNNNLHYVHHENPRVAWYDLPALYRSEREKFLAANESYLFRGYSDMLRLYFFRQKTQVAHPYLRRG